MKSVKALLSVMVFSLSILAGCTSTPTEAPSDTATTRVNVPVQDTTVPTTNTDTPVTDETTGTTGVTGTPETVPPTVPPTVENTANDTGVTTTDDSSAATGETAE